MENSTNFQQTKWRKKGFNVFDPGSGPSSKRALVKKRFVNARILILVFVLSITYLVLHSMNMTERSVYLVAIIEAIMFFLVWNKLYQILYDLKLLFFFNDKYDLNLTLASSGRYPTITFIVPAYQEPFKVAKMTIDSIANAPYRGRKEIIVVDNSQNVLSDDFLRLKKYIEDYPGLHPEMNISSKFVYNSRRDTLKPGNLDLAEKCIEEGEFVVIVDVDSTLPANVNLLEKAVAEFLMDRRLGFLQFSMKATNSHFNDLTQSIAASQDLHRLRLTSRSYGGYKIFEGHNGMWRRTVLEKIGAWTDYYKGSIMITEDILKSAQVYSIGYYGKSLSIKTGEWVPASLDALESMWMRWTYGTSQVLFKYFKNLYSRRVSLIERFDVSYHVLHHFAHGFIIPMAILLQLIVPGPLSAAFIMMVYIFPQAVGAVTIYFRSLKALDVPFLKKMKYLYGGYFLVDTFIMSTQLRSSINFLAGVPQGWRVTEKGIENRLKWSVLLMNKAFHLAIAGVTVLVCATSWVLYYNMEPGQLYHYALPVFLAMNLVLCIVVYGREGRRGHNNVESAMIGAQPAVQSEAVAEKELALAEDLEEVDELADTEVMYIYH